MRKQRGREGKEGRGGQERTDYVQKGAKMHVTNHSL